MKKTNTIPLYRATQSLDVSYFFNGEKEQAKIPLSGAYAHAILRHGSDVFLKKRSDSKYTASIDKLNFATAMVTVFYTDTQTEEGYLGEDIEKATYPVQVLDQEDRILSSMDFYTNKEVCEGVTASKAARDQGFNASLTERIKSFSEVVAQYDLPGGTIDSVDSLNEKIQDSMFHETFHHSEQALMHYLSSQVALMGIVNSVKENKAKYVYGVVLDIYTQRMLCCNCNACLIGMQHSQAQGFIANLNKALKREGVETRVNGNIMLQTRVSASKAPKGTTLDPLRLGNDEGVVHEYNPDKDNFVLQAENKALGVRKLINNEKVPEYRGVLFSSSQIGGKIKWERAMRLSPR